MAYGGSNDDVIDEVTWSSEFKVVILISLKPIISKTAWDRDSVLTGNHLPPQPDIKAVKKFTWRMLCTIWAHSSLCFAFLKTICVYSRPTVASRPVVCNSLWCCVWCFRLCTPHFGQRHQTSVCTGEHHGARLWAVRRAFESGCPDPQTACRCSQWQNSV